MNLKKLFGLFAVAGLVAIAAPTERANAMSINSPGLAAAVQENISNQAITDVQYRRHDRRYRPHRHYRPHHHQSRRHYGYRPPMIVHRPPPRVHRYYRY